MICEHIKELEDRISEVEAELKEKYGADIYFELGCGCCGGGWYCDLCDK